MLRTLGLFGLGAAGFAFILVSALVPVPADLARRRLGGKGRAGAVRSGRGSQLHEPLRVLAVHRNIDGKLLFGVNVIRDAPGHVRVGDPVEVL
jgi:hypothetical protein